MRSTSFSRMSRIELSCTDIECLIKLMRLISEVSGVLDRLRPMLHLFEKYFWAVSWDGD